MRVNGGTATDSLERTRQQFDPTGSAGIRAMTTSLCVGAVVYAVIITVRSLGGVLHPLAAGLALVALLVACGIVVWASSPDRAPLTGRAHFLAVATAIAAIALEAASQWNSNAAVLDDWGPVTLGIIFVALGPYRPAREIATAGVLSALGIVVLLLLQVDSIPADSPFVARVVLAVTPMLALCFSAAAFSFGSVASIEASHERSRAESVALVTELRGGIARSVRADRITILSRDVLPFFGDVLQRDAMTDEDRRRAREIADSIRRVMVEEVDRSWLETLVELARTHDSFGAGSVRDVVSDPEHVASSMSTDQRTVIRAAFVALLDSPGFDRSHLRIEFSIVDERAEVQMRIRIADPSTRANLAPYAAVIRAVFTNLEVVFVHPVVTLGFSYELL